MTPFPAKHTYDVNLARKHAQSHKQHTLEFPWRSSNAVHRGLGFITRPCNREDGRRLFPSWMQLTCSAVLNCCESIAEPTTRAIIIQKNLLQQRDPGSSIPLATLTPRVLVVIPMRQVGGILRTDMLLFCGRRGVVCSDLMVPTLPTALRACFLARPCSV